MQNERLIEELRRLGRGGIATVPQNGTCNVLSRLVDEDHERERIFRLFKKWPEYSGHPLYPVPAPMAGISPREAYTRFQLWGDDGYGRARRRLCLWLADYLENENAS